MLSTNQGDPTFNGWPHHSPETESAIPQQAQLTKPADPVSILRSAERILQCDVQRFVQDGRISGPEKDKRDLMIYLLWKTGSFSNDQIGRLFGISYSAISHAVRSFKVKTHDNPLLLEAFDNIYSQSKLWPYLYRVPFGNFNRANLGLKVQLLGLNP